MQLLTSDDQLLKALYYKSKNFLDKPTPAWGDLIYKNIFPYSYIPDSVEESKSYLTMSVSYRPSGQSFKVGSITLNTFCHKNLMETNHGCLRIDFIVSRIDTVLNSSRDFGIGKLQFDGAGETLIEGKLPGMAIRYLTVDFQ